MTRVQRSQSDPPEHDVATAAEAEFESPGDQLVRLAKSLYEHGVTQTHVKRILMSYEPDRIDRQIKWLKHRRFRSPAKMLVAAIDNDYEIPAALASKESSQPVEGNR